MIDTLCTLKTNSEAQPNKLLSRFTDKFVLWVLGDKKQGITDNHANCSVCDELNIWHSEWYELLLPANFYVLGFVYSLCIEALNAPFDIQHLSSRLTFIYKEINEDDADIWSVFCWIQIWHKKKCKTVKKADRSFESSFLASVPKYSQPSFLRINEMGSSNDEKDTHKFCKLESPISTRPRFLISYLSNPPTLAAV